MFQDPAVAWVSGEWRLLSKLSISHDVHSGGGHQGGWEGENTRLPATVGQASPRSRQRAMENESVGKGLQANPPTQTATEKGGAGDQGNGHLCPQPE